MEQKKINQSIETIKNPKHDLKKFIITRKCQNIRLK
jgi:hypothetical protein